MSCGCDHTLCCDMLTTSDAGSTSVRELYRRPSRRRYTRHGSRGRLLLQHVSCPSTFPKSKDEQSTSTADELGAWASRRTHSDLPPLAAQRRYKASRPSLRASRPYVLPLGRRPSRLHRTTTIVHHPCCLYDPKLCPLMRSTHRRQKFRVEDIDSDVLRAPEEFRSHIESFLREHQHRHTKDPPVPPQTAAKHAATTQHRQTSERSAAQEKRCEICGSSQHVFAQTPEHLVHASRPTTEQATHQVEANLLTEPMSSDTADRLLEELNRRSTGPARVSVGNNVELRGGTSFADHLPATFNTHREATQRIPVTVQVAPRRLSAVNHSHTMTETPPVYVQSKKIPTPRNRPISPLATYHCSQPVAVVQGAGKEIWRPMRNLPDSSGQATEVTLTKSDEATSYTMQSITAARAAVKPPVMSSNDGPWHQQATGNYSHRDLDDDIRTARRIQQESGSTFSNSWGQAGKEVSQSPRGTNPITVSVSPATSHNVSSFGGYSGPEIDVLAQSEPNSARLTARTYTSDISGKPKIRQDTGHIVTFSSPGLLNGRDLQSGGQTPTCSANMLSHRDRAVGEVDRWGCSEGKVKLVPETDDSSKRVSSNGKRSEITTVINSAIGQFLPNSNHSSPSSSKNSARKIPLCLDGIVFNEKSMKQEQFVPNDSDRTGSENGSIHSKNTFFSPSNKVDEVVETSFCSDDTGCSYQTKSDNLGKSSRDGGENVDPRSNGEFVTRKQSHSLASSVRSGCRETQKEETKDVYDSCPTTLCCTPSSSKSASLRRAETRKGAGSGANKDSVCTTPSYSQESRTDQLEASCKLISQKINKALSIIENNGNSNTKDPKVQGDEEEKVRTERKSPPLDVANTADLVPTRDCSPGRLSSQLWHHVDSAIRDTLGNAAQSRVSGEAAASSVSVEERKSKKLLLKLRRDLTKNILMNLKHLENIESSLHCFHTATPPAST